MTKNQFRIILFTLRDRSIQSGVLSDSIIERIADIFAATNDVQMAINVMRETVLHAQALDHSEVTDTDLVETLSKLDGYIKTYRGEKN
jgi:Cdc6-like AAA superfamily ATPase